MTALQSISTYQMQMQSYSSRANELYKNGDNASLSLASSLKQQLSSVQGRLSAVKSSNNNVLLNNERSALNLEKYTYDNKATVSREAASTYDVYA